MAKQLRCTVFWIKHFGKSSSKPLKSNIDTKKDALERSISGFKHDIILEKNNVILVGCFLKSSTLFDLFARSLCPRLQKEDLIFFQWFTVCFSCDRDEFLTGGAAKSCSNPQIWTKQKHQTLSWDACDLGTTTRTRKRPSGWKPLITVSASSHHMHLSKETNILHGPPPHQFYQLINLGIGHNEWMVLPCHKSQQFPSFIHQKIAYQFRNYHH